MAQEYQSEKSPIIDSQKSKKTRRKLLKMSHIKASKVDQMFCNTIKAVHDGQKFPCIFRDITNQFMKDCPIR